MMCESLLVTHHEISQEISMQQINISANLVRWPGKDSPSD